MISASEQAYLKIRDMIVRGELRAGEQLVAEELALSCGFSRTPVREAILRLQAEMFAERLDNKRTIVRSWSTGEIEDFVELRVRIAGYTAARAAARITPDQVAALKHLNDMLEALLSGETRQSRFYEVNSDFHTSIISIAASERLTRISWQLINPAPLLRSIEQNTKERLTEIVADNRALVAALEANDPVWAEAAMTVHIRKTYAPKRG